jgi:hypothetical protein
MKKTKSIAALTLLAFVLLATPSRAQHSVSLTWTASTSASGNPSLTYNIYRSFACSGTFVRLNTTPISTSGFLDVAVPPGTYCYQATAVLSGLESTPSNQASAVVTAVVTVPATPQAACPHHGPVIGWIRCIGSRPRRVPKTNP